jgi:luciferase family oxidoreductase group 1
MTLPLSILDLAPVRPGQTVADSLAASVTLAQLAEQLGYRRVWYAEHHNNSAIASSAPVVLIAHVAAFTHDIRLGAGGVMLPNHAPLTIAEQFGTLEALHPGRIDLGLGRAPGTDQAAMRALRRYGASADRFYEDILELQGYFGGEPVVPDVEATPGKGAQVPLYILGSSTFGARLAALLGLPYAFASHFAPQALEEAVAIYRREFRPSAQLAEPYVIAGVNVIAADTSAEAREQLVLAQRHRVTARLGRGQVFTDGEADLVLRSPVGEQILETFTYTAVGNPAEVGDYVTKFAKHAQADELIVAHQLLSVEARLRSVELLAESVGQSRAA